MDRRWVYAGLIAIVGAGLAKALIQPRIRRGDRILLVGDSLAVGLAPHLAALAKDTGASFQALATVGTRIDQWADSDALTKALDAVQPTLVLISLGTNDEYLQGDAVARQRPYLEKLLQKIEQYSHKQDYGLGPDAIVWIGPPTLPKPTVGIVAMVQEAAAGLRPRISYFPTQTLTIPRGPDHIHPTARGYAGWAGALWQWLS